MLSFRMLSFSFLFSEKQRMTIENALKAFRDYVGTYSLSMELYRDILDHAREHSERPNDISFAYALIDTAAIVGYMAGKVDTFLEYLLEIFGTVFFEDPEEILEAMAEQPGKI